MNSNKNLKLIVFGLVMIAFAISLPGADPLRVMVSAGLGTISMILINVFR